MSKVTVLGAGAWGTALAKVLVDAGNSVCLVARDIAQVSRMRTTRQNERYLPGIDLPEALEILHMAESFSDLGEAGLGLVLVAIPYQQARSILRDIAVKSVAIDGIVWASKGIEENTHALAHEIVATEINDRLPFAVLSGPNFAAEVARRQPAAVTVAATQENFAQEICRTFHTDYFRPYSSNDVIGVEVGGAVKNVIAIAAGISDGLKLGANARAALVTRGLAEIARWGKHRGGRTETFMGLSGLGDLVLTCTDDLSRNRRFGLALAAGKRLEQAIAEVGLVEGAKTAVAVAEVAASRNIAMPIATQVAAVTSGKTSAKAAVTALMARDLGREN